MNSTQTAALPYEQLTKVLEGLNDPWLKLWPALLILAFVLALGILWFWRRCRERTELEHEYRNETAAEPVESTVAVDQSPESVPESSERVSILDELKGVDESVWLRRLSSGLTRTRDGLKNSLMGLLGGQSALDAAMLERIHEILYRADVGVATADVLVEAIRSDASLKSRCDWDLLKSALSAKVADILVKVQKPISTPVDKPMVILVVGVNGVGKTTTIGKLGAHLMARGMTPMLCAADTFRAGAIDQLQVWADRLGAQIVRHQPGSDPAAVAFDGVKAAKSRGADVLLIDTAGRLHNKEELMAQLDKIKRIIARELPGAPHETWLVLDATTGQNAVMQVKAFREVADVTGLVVTKLDGTAKGGVLIGIADQFNIPVRYVGVGERVGDLHEFNAADYAKSLFE